MRCFSLARLQMLPDGVHIPLLSGEERRAHILVAAARQDHEVEQHSAREQLRRVLLMYQTKVIELGAQDAAGSDDDDDAGSGVDPGSLFLSRLTPSTNGI